MMLVPLTVDGEHVGFYAIYHDITELQRAREQAETLLAVTQVLGKTLSLEDTIETILDELQRVVPYDSCSIQVIQGNRLVIVSGRGLDDLGGLHRSGLRPGRRDQPQCPGRAVEAATGLRRRLAPPVLCEPDARRRTHSRMDLCADDGRRPRHRRHQRRQVRARLLRRGAGGARDGIRLPGRDGDRERSVARHRARRPRTGRDAARGSRVAQQHIGSCPRSSI